MESELGKGTRFHFSIPVVQCDVQCEPAPADMGVLKGGVSWTLLVGEDSDISFKLIEAMLSARFRLVRARSGAEAAELFRSERPDAVLVDTRLPVMDGFEVTRRIRESAPDLPVVVMSAYPSDREAESAVAAGCTGFLPKPFTQAELHKMLNTCLVNLESRK